MKHLCTAFLLCLACVARGQSLGFEVETNGWVMNVYATGMGTGGTYTFGLSTNNEASSLSSMLVGITSQGYGDAGEPVTVRRYVVGQYALRKAYPNEASKDETLVSQGVKFRIVLSERIHAGDSNIVVNVASGLYAQGGTNSIAGFNIAATNNSAIPYPKTLAKWAWPGFENIRTASWTNRVWAAQAFGDQGRPVRAVKFWVTDKNGTTVTNWQTQMKRDVGWGDEIPFPEWVSVFQTNQFAAETLLTMNFAAFPWVGDTNSVYDSSKSTFSQPTPRAAPITNSIYAPTFAIVDSVNGTNSTGVAAPLATYQSNTNLARFRDMAGALTAIQATNGIAYSRTNVGAGVLLMSETGTHTTLGATVTLTGNQSVAYEVMPYPGTDPYASRFVALSDNRLKDDSDMRIDRGTYWDTTASTLISRHKHWWLDGGVILNATGAALWDNASLAMNVYITRSVISNLTQGLRQPSTHNCQVALLRGNKIVGNLNNTAIEARAMFGNRNYPGFANYTVTDQISGTAGDSDHTLIAYNAFYNLDKLASVLSLGASTGISEGICLANNVFEAGTNDSATISFQITTNPDLQYTNVLVWYNLLAGAKTFLAYQDEGTNFQARFWFSVHGNIFEDFNIKTDPFVGSGGPSGNRWGNWELVFGVSESGNACLETTSAGGNDLAHGIGAPGSFLPDFMGLNSWGTTTTTTSSTNYVRFINRQCNDGTTPNMPGFGDYRLHSTSPLWRRNRQTRWLLPCDLYGVPRSRLDGPGPFVSGNPRRMGL